ncbi:MAG: hypothetical protein Q4G70_14920 [Pseudomonadota bacterium]|nr:hypothetical protein [Pseudomonadota bacterium]
MYSFLIWNKNIAAKGIDGAMNIYNIPLELAKLFFKLDATKFPILSSLSFDDYDLFSDTQLDSLNFELENFSPGKDLFPEDIKKMMEMIIVAKDLKMSVLFDPFRKM